MDYNSFEFQDWMASKGYTDVRFYPKNAKESSTVDLLECASNAVRAYEKGQGVAYEDNIETYM